jgi:hypothetical protein
MTTATPTVTPTPTLALSVSEEALTSVVPNVYIIYEFIMRVSFGPRSGVSVWIRIRVRARVRVTVSGVRVRVGVRNVEGRKTMLKNTLERAFTLPSIY